MPIEPINLLRLHAKLYNRLTQNLLSMQNNSVFERIQPYSHNGKSHLLFLSKYLNTQKDLSKPDLMTSFFSQRTGLLIPFSGDFKAIDRVLKENIPTLEHNFFTHKRHKTRKESYGEYTVSIHENNLSFVINFERNTDVFNVHATDLSLTSLQDGVAKMKDTSEHEKLRILKTLQEKGCEPIITILKEARLREFILLSDNLEPFFFNVTKEAQKEHIETLHTTEWPKDYTFPVLEKRFFEDFEKRILIGCIGQIHISHLNITKNTTPDGHAVLNVAIISNLKKDKKWRDLTVPDYENITETIKALYSLLPQNDHGRIPSKPKRTTEWTAPGDDGKFLFTPRWINAYGCYHTAKNEKIFFDFQLYNPLKTYAKLQQQNATKPNPHIPNIIALLEKHYTAIVEHIRHFQKEQEPIKACSPGTATSSNGEHTLDWTELHKILMLHTVRENTISQKKEKVYCLGCSKDSVKQQMHAMALPERKDNDYTR